jgi:hypothetical protein
VEAYVELVEREYERPKERKRSTSLAEAPFDILEPLVDMAEYRTAQTPISASVKESFFQSGIRSVKKLLWRSDTF